MKERVGGKKRGPENVIESVKEIKGNGNVK